MGPAAVYQRPRGGVPHRERMIHSYQLRDLGIDRPNQVWCADITPLRMRRGFLCLGAVLDLASRKVCLVRVEHNRRGVQCRGRATASASGSVTNDRMSDRRPTSINGG
jgi:putative transposase